MTTLSADATTAATAATTSLPAADPTPEAVCRPLQADALGASCADDGANREDHGPHQQRQEAGELDYDEEKYIEDQRHPASEMADDVSHFHHDELAARHDELSPEPRK